MTNVITTVAELKKIVAGGDVNVSTRTPKGYPDKIIVKSGDVDLVDVIVEGMHITFVDCLITGKGLVGVFKDCEIDLYECELHTVVFDNCKTFVSDTELINSSLRGTVFLESTAPGETTLEQCTISSAVLYAAQDLLAEIYTCINPQVTIATATTSCSHFGTYNGNVYYLGEIDMVIAGCWMGTLEEFRGKAVRQGVPKARYEAVYNYFKSFNKEGI